MTTTTTMINAGADVCGAIRFKFKLFKYINNNGVMIILILILSLLTNTSSATTTTTTTSNSNTVNYTFAIIPKSINNIFFEDVIKGCDYRSNELLLTTTATTTTTAVTTNVTCLFIGPGTQNAMEQVAVIDELIFNHNHNNQKIDGIAVSVIDSNAIKNVLLKAKLYGIQVITFDSDIEIDTYTDDINDASTTTTTTTTTATNSSSSSLKIKYRSAYVGTDNIAFGEQIGKTLIELAANTANAGGEEGGDVRIHKFGIISNTDPNILLREKGLRNVLSKNSNNSNSSNSNNNTWIEVHQSPMDMKDNKYLALGQMHILTVENSPTAIVSLLGGPMFDTTTDRGWEAFATTHDNPNLLLVSADSLPIQVELLHKGYANGLVGQLPFDMGMKSFDTLLNLVTIQNNENEQQQQQQPVTEIIYTDLIEFVLLSSSSSEDGDGKSGGDSGIAPPSIIEDGDIDSNNDDDDDDDNDIKTSYVFAIVSKSINIPFFDDVKAGCEARAATIMRRTSNQVNIECLYTGPIEQDDPIEQAKIIEDLILNNNNGNGNNTNDTVKVDGIAFSVIDSNVAYNLTIMAQNANIPIITFDSDAPLSKRIAYIGTDNIQLGNELANTLLLVVNEENENGKEQQNKQQKQKTYGVLSNHDPNLQLRETGLNDILLSTSSTSLTSSTSTSILWKQVNISPTNFGGNTTLAFEQMNDLITNNTRYIDAIFSTAGRPMRDVEKWKDYVSNIVNTNTNNNTPDNNNNNKIKLIVADTHPDQVKLLQQKYVNGLVGQTPYLMGSLSIDVLLKLATKQATTATATATTTLLDNSSGSGNANDNTDTDTDIDIEEYMYTNLVRARLIESKNQNDNIDDSDGNGDDDGDGNDDSSNASSLLSSLLFSCFFVACVFLSL